MTQPPKKDHKNLFIYGLFILLLFSLWIPLMPLITFWFLPLPFLLFAANFRSSGLLPLFILICAGISYLFGGPILAAMIIFAAITGITMGWMYQRKDTSGLEVFMSGLFSGAASLLILTIIANQWYGLLDLFQEMLEEQWAATEQLLESYGMEDEQLLGAPLPIGVFLPSMIAYLSLITSLINLWIGRRILIRWKFPGKYLPPFRDWRLPRAFFFFYFIVILISFFTEADQSYWAAILSLQLLLWQLFLIQGFSFISFFLHTAGKGRIWLLLTILISLLLPPFALFVHFLGILDTGTQIRKLIQKRRKKD